MVLREARIELMISNLQGLVNPLCSQLFRTRSALTAPRVCVASQVHTGCPWLRVFACATGAVLQTMTQPKPPSPKI